MTEINVPSWVYNNLKNYGNCALGYQYNNYSIEQLSKVFKKCVIKKAKYCTTAEIGKPHSKYKDYYIVWTKEAIKKYAYRTK